MGIGALLDVDFSRVEHLVLRKAIIDNTLRDIRSRAGAPGRIRAAVYYSLDDERPPTLQWYNRKTGRRRNGKSHRGHSARRVVVGRDWLRAHMPAGFAAMCAERLSGGQHVIQQLTVE